MIFISYVDFYVGVKFAMYCKLGDKFCEKKIEMQNSQHFESLEAKIAVKP